LASWLPRLQFLQQIDFLVCQGPVVSGRGELAEELEDRGGDHANQSD
jgi:hypothetical protein